MKPGGVLPGVDPQWPPPPVLALVISPGFPRFFWRRPNAAPPRKRPPKKKPPFPEAFYGNRRSPLDLPFARPPGPPGKGEPIFLLRSRPGQSRPLGPPSVFSPPPCESLGLVRGPVPSFPPP